MNRILKMMIAVFAVLTATVGCQNPQEEIKPANLILETTTFEAPAEGGSYSINYTLENPVEVFI